MTEQQKLRELLENSSHIVFFGGAGVSTESNIPDFRSEDGLYGSKQAKTYPYPPETMLSHSFFKRHTEQFFEYYFDRMVYPQAKPNAAHYALAELEAQGKLSAVVTQNIDGLHQQAGSKPDVVLYEESLDSDVLEGAVRHIMAADLLIVGGTSLAVYPAAGLLQYYGGRELVLINKTETPYDRKASLVIRQPIGKVLSKAVEGL